MRLANYRGFSIDINRIDKYQTYVRVTNNSTGRVFDDFANTGTETVHELKQMMKDRIDAYVDLDSNED